MRAAEKKNDFRKGLSKLNKRLVKMKTNGIFTCIALIALFVSCKSGLVHETVYDNNHLVANVNNRIDVLNPGNNYDHAYTSAYSKMYSVGHTESFHYYDDIALCSQCNAIYDLENKILKHPEKSKYRDALEAYKNKLYNEYRERVQSRMLFLRDFYSDMYRLSNKEFSKKYMKHCDKSLMDSINKINFKEVKLEGDKWVVFTDLMSHRSQDYKFSYMDGDPAKVGDKNIAFYIYKSKKKNVKKYLYEGEYHLLDQEDKWYKVSMGNNFAMIKIDGKKTFKITNLINPSVPFVF